MDHQTNKSAKIKPKADPSSTSQRVARKWIAVGGALIVFTSLFAVSAFLFDMPVQRANAERLTTNAEFALGLLFVGGGGGVFLALGLLIRRSR